MKKVLFWVLLGANVLILASCIRALPVTRMDYRNESPAPTSGPDSVGASISHFPIYTPRTVYGNN